MAGPNANIGHILLTSCLLCTQLMWGCTVTLDLIFLLWMCIYMTCMFIYVCMCVKARGTPSTSLWIETPGVQWGPDTSLSLPPRIEMSSTHYHIWQFSMGLRNQILILVPSQVLYGRTPLPWAGFGHSDHRTLQVSPSSPAGSKGWERI